MEERGDVIPGSRYLRDFCAECNEPIRVVAVGVNYCNACKPAVVEKLPGMHIVGEKLHLGKPKPKKKRKK